MIQYQDEQLFCPGASALIVFWFVTLCYELSCRQSWEANSSKRGNNHPHPSIGHQPENHGTGTVRDSERGDVDVRQYAGNEQMRCEKKKVVVTVITIKVRVLEYSSTNTGIFY